LILSFLLSLFLSGSPAHSDACTLQMELTGVIGAGTVDQFARAERIAREKSCGSILVLINTPGGNLQSTHLVVEQILNSKIPYLCLVTPAGGHAGSAGAILLLACHVAGGLETTNIGAATPIMGSGEDVKGDLRNKMINDTTSWLQGIAELRGRNKKFSEEIVTKAESVSSAKAKELGAIDILATSVDDFLKKANGLKVKMSATETSEIHSGPLVEFKKDFRTQFLDFVSNPELVYLIFMGSLALLYFEITHPGMAAPGVIGGFGLILSLISFHILNVQWGGFALVILGLGLLIAEAFLPSFGFLGIGGMAAFVCGGLFLFDFESSGYSLPLNLILPTAIIVGGLMLMVAYFAAQALKVKKTSGVDSILHRDGKVTVIDSGGLTGRIEVGGEIWNFESLTPLSVGDAVRITSIHGLKVTVHKKEVS
jgi:membrane-bound serine protease (ClpP class)